MRWTSSPTTASSRSSGHGADRRSSQFLGGVEELRGFTDAGDTAGWAHHILWSGTQGDVEFALGETRMDDTGERIGTFLCVAQLDEEEDAALHGRPHAGSKSKTNRRPRQRRIALSGCLARLGLDLGRLRPARPRAFADNRSTSPALSASEEPSATSASPISTSIANCKLQIAKVNLKCPRRT